MSIAASEHDPLTNTTRPLSDSIITVRLIKSFTFRTVKNLVLPHVNLQDTTVGSLKALIHDEITKQSALKPYRTSKLDTLKIYTKAHGAKTTNLIINLENDDSILEDERQTLAKAGLENEAEVSFFSRADYEAFKVNPETKW